MPASTAPGRVALLAGLYRTGLDTGLAEAVRFELTEGIAPSRVFKTRALNRSATPPVDSSHDRLNRGQAGAYYRQPRTVCIDPS